MKVSLQHDKNNGYLHEDQFTCLTYLEENILRTKTVGKIQIHLTFDYFYFFRKTCC